MINHTLCTNGLNVPPISSPAATTKIKRLHKHSEFLKPHFSLVNLRHRKYDDQYLTNRWTKMKNWFWHAFTWPSKPRDVARMCNYALEIVKLQPLKFRGFRDRYLSSQNFLWINRENWSYDSCHCNRQTWWSHPSFMSV